MQLRPGDQFFISSRRFSLAISEPDAVLLTPSISDQSTVVDLEDEEVENADTNLPLQGGGNAETVGASSSHHSLPGDEIDMFGSADVAVSHDAAVDEPSSKSQLSDADAGLVGSSSPEGNLKISTENADGVHQAPEVTGSTSVLEELEPERAPTIVGMETAEDVRPVGSRRTPISAEEIDISKDLLDGINALSAQSSRQPSQAHSEPGDTESRSSLAQSIPEDDKALENDAGTPSVVNQAEVTPKEEAEEVQQPTKEQPLETAQRRTGVDFTGSQATDPMGGSPSPSSPRISRASSHKDLDAIVVADQGVQSTVQEDSEQQPNVLQQAQDDVDTQSSTIARVDGLLQFAGVDSDANNNVAQSEGELAESSPGRVTRTSDADAESKEKKWFEPGMNLATVGDESTESGAELDSPAPATLRGRGRPKVTQPSKLRKSLKRKQESPDEIASLPLKTPVKRRKVKDTESSMESTIEVRPRSSRRSMTSSQTVNRETRGVSALSTEPNFSSPSQRPTQSQETGAGSYDRPPPRVIFSSNSTVDERVNLMAFFTRQGGKQVKAVKDCTILCVGPGELKKTGKLLLAVASGKDIVRDKWLIDSSKCRRLLDPKPYFAEDQERELEWGTTLADATARGKAGTKPFADLTIYFTPALKKELGTGFTELKEVAILAGAVAVHARLPPKGAVPKTNILVLASSRDRDATTLTEAGWTCYTKDVISMSVLQGALNTESFERDF